MPFCPGKKTQNVFIPGNTGKDMHTFSMWDMENGNKQGMLENLLVVGIKH